MGHFINMILRNRVWRQYAGRVTGMDTGLFNMFHHTANDGFFTVTDGIYIQLKGLFKEFINEHRLVRRRLDSQIKVFFKVVFIKYNFHGAAA